MVDMICREIDLKKNRIAAEVGSIYFGGGTPSVLSTPHFEQVFNTIYKNFSVAADAEITIEANPDDLHAGKLEQLKKLPVNRFSIGIQSFFEEDLIWMNRAHNALEAESCIKRSQDAGFDNLSIDLIYGYPLLTNTKWEQNIDMAIAFNTPHISAYSLTVEPKTALANAIKRGKDIPPTDEQSAEQFGMLRKELAIAGYEHYEISNFSKPGKYAVHNTNYWKGIPYLGIGPSAHGFDGDKRYLNIANNALYIKHLQDGTLPETIEGLSVYDRFNEYIMTSLRTMWGTSLDKIETEFGSTFLKQTIKNSNRFVRKAWLRQDNETLALTEEGKLFADYIASELFLSEEDHG